MGRSRGWAIVAGLLGITLLYADALRTPFLSDDYLFVEEARDRPLVASLLHPGQLGSYYRPLSRQVYFKALTPVSGLRPGVFHVASVALFLVALVLLGDLLRALVPLRGALLGALYFALLPMQRVNLMWSSCAQDLLALVGCLAALAFHRRSRHGWALAAYALAITSKESALPLPLALATWDLWVLRQPARTAARRALPFAVVGGAWAIVSTLARTAGAAPDGLAWGWRAFASGYLHMAQSLIGLGDPAGTWHALTRSLPPLVPLVALLAITPWFVAAKVEGPDLPARESSLKLAAVWLAGFGLVIGPASPSWCEYHSTLAAVGGAILVGGLARNAAWIAWPGLVAALLWWHAASANAPGRGLPGHASATTSYLTAPDLRLAADRSDSLTSQLDRLSPIPTPETRFFFATLPSWAAFQLADGALARVHYRDPTLRSHFYSQFSDSLTGAHPCEFLYWDGQELRRLYPDAPGRFFQVGADLLLLDRPKGAAAAFRRGLEEPGGQVDNLYGLGWAEAWSGRPEAADAAWKAFGARDDSSCWASNLAAGRKALADGPDSLAARRRLFAAIACGITRAEAHAALGRLLMARTPKYGLLELAVACRLDPGDAATRRELEVGRVLAGFGLR